MTRSIRTTVPALLVAALLLGGCSMSLFSNVESAEADEVTGRMTTIIDDAVAASSLPVTRERLEPAKRLTCADGEGERMTMKVNADDPPELEPLADALVDHLVAEGWELTSTLPIDGEAGPSESRFLLRDGYEAIVDVVRGTEGTGVDLELLSPCLAFDD